MKVKINYLNDTSNASKNDKPNWASEARRRNHVDDSESAAKTKQTDSPLKEEMKFANLLNSAAKLQKPGQRDDDSSQERREDEKKERMREKESSESAAGDGKTEKYDSSGSGQFGGQSGFGERGNVGHLNLNDAFAARSILHIADLERLISTIRSQALLGGKREIILQLRRSVLEGLQVKITTDPTTKVQIEFLAANETVRSEIEKHSEELAGILRGRGINLENLKTTVNSGGEEKGSSSNETSFVLNVGKDSVTEESRLLDDNTFDDSPENKDTIYQA